MTLFPAVALVLGVFGALLRRKPVEDKRCEIVRQAEQELELYPAGRPDTYWREAGQPPNDKDWCGAFYVAMLHRAGVALEHDWVMGKGFAWPAGLPTTKDPKPGDLLYQDQPYQHHALIVAVSPLTVTTIDGNPGLRRTVRRRDQTPRIAFYSIARYV
jgi:hypothetical protein